MKRFLQWAEPKQLRKIIIIAFFSMSALLWGAWRIYSYFYVSTDDAYINANVIQIAPRITGQVKSLLVINNQYVKKGEVLFTIDDQPFQIALYKAKANLELSVAKWKNADATAKRMFALVLKHVASQQQGDDAKAALNVAEATVNVAQAEVNQAELNLAYTTVTAPHNGWISNLSLRTGDMVTLDQPLFALVCDNEFWADANFKETEMAEIAAGQRATITTDLYPDHPFEAVVESISPSSGTAFSLLPPQNATGNWVKVTQRVPVRVRVLTTDAQYPLRVGLSATVTVHLRQYQNENHADDRRTL